MAEQPACPVCGTGLETLAVLAGERGLTVRIGTCPDCGYAGYRDRPRREWISRYYADVWSHGAEKDVRALKTKRPAENAITATLRRALEMLGDRRRPVLEIGAGYGTLLRSVRGAGFVKVIGIESSLKRAALAAKAAGLPVLAGDFESPAIQGELARRAPFGLIYLFHVLEHTHQPAEIIAAIARLQSPGDLLVAGVPNLEGEPAMNILLFLPHLHSFTLRSLAELLGRTGYGIVDASFSDGVNLNIIARKGAPNTAAPEARPPDLKAKFERELALHNLAPMGRQRYFWSKKYADSSGIEPYRLYWRIADYLRGREGMRSLVIEPLGESSAAAPVVISFPRDPFLCIK